MHANDPTDGHHPLAPSHAFVVRIWWESGLTGPDGRPLWRGQIRHAATGRTLTFQSLQELLRFIQKQTGDLESVEGQREDFFVHSIE